MTSIPPHRPPIYTAAEAQAVAMEIDRVVDAYVLSEGEGSITLTAVVVPGTSVALVLSRLEAMFEGRTKAGIVWSFEVLEGEGPS